MNSHGEIITHTCECGHTHRISEREIGLYRGMVSALWIVYKWCKGRGGNEFQMREVRDMIGKIEYTRFGDWKKFGGMVYEPEEDGKRKGKGYYGLNMERCEAYFRGEYKIPLRVWKNPISKELRPEDYKTIKEVPALYELLTSDREYIANYRDPNATVNL